ncbi:hypothetical protein DUNSADRAFT_44 [Dunaliella salina]|uniref:Secreted protein n=1 Tax=Dunaliella salina TaxID=3046 RepID=A0ABQ7HAP6_DUNSA|nr:hypothetical protein DUNSADRAFT_44 [Dunaliella salina]|eukprot:KAF5843922.1 hypothetical protein DUNSADRAFT_44 [Dunaliella salina]
MPSSGQSKWLKVEPFVRCVVCITVRALVRAPIDRVCCQCMLPDRFLREGDIHAHVKTLVCTAPAPTACCTAAARCLQLNTSSCTSLPSNKQASSQ